MYKKKMTWWVSAAMVFLLLALTGCQAVQGLDLAEAIKNSATVKSSESKGTLQIEFVPGDTSKLTADEQKSLSALQNVKVELTNVKTQNAQQTSAEGTITYGKGSIPFKLATKGTKIILSIEGAKKPIVYDVLGASDATVTKMLPTVIQEQFGNKLAEIKSSVIGLILANTANPSNISVTSVTDKVNGADLSLQQAHIELNGTELATLLQKLFSNILADEAGLKDLLSQFYDALSPVIEEQVKAGSADFALTILSNKQLAIGLVYEPIRDFLEKTAASFEEAIAGNAEQGVMPIKGLFDAKSTLQADLYIDADKFIRKQTLAANIPLPDKGTGAAGLKISFTSETWNMDKPVTAETIDISGGAVQVGKDASSIYRVLDNLDKQSTFYKLLREDMKVTKKEVNLKLADGDAGSTSDTPQPFINADNKTMVPVRFISEKLGAEVGWNGDLQEVTIKDLLSGKTIVLKLDSKMATVDGASIELESAATLHNGSTFVPIRFIAESLGGKVSFDDETRVVTIKRD
ncbi:copper amine oxidase N-terminal domain-containing protein [Paenibacillus sp. CGMCC 1.16610]|uniref:Copper amine oxidase N-terminal domain-containing protein n=1 Tax=Paenibacillus anseongense TaxID=2682845 RepID=A0ABW9UGF8_9BACL|nr:MULTISPECIES: copper amine oxidase N-terminal domain-containing protein [Paenibacillus]MBA2942773.1 copper amine oxidase N-terminal domain-containing protein [Paenibacillus sp. CGMCC 1.16610]MVQ38258.1 copper amine oxidase N-terminal domain-containing protein [Paenibacillus anseongense]